MSSFLFDPETMQRLANQVARGPLDPNKQKQLAAQEEEQNYGGGNTEWGGGDSYYDPNSGHFTAVGQAPAPTSGALLDPGPEQPAGIVELNAPAFAGVNLTGGRRSAYGSGSRTSDLGGQGMSRMMNELQNYRMALIRQYSGGKF